MTDNSSDISGDFGIGLKLTCILAEGTATVNTSAVDMGGNKTTVTTYASPRAKGDYVELDTGTYNLYAACKGLPVVSAVASTGIIGRIVSNPKQVKRPSATKTVTNTSSADWGTLLAGEWYRTATVEFFGVIGALPIDILHAGTSNITPGETATIKYDVGDASFTDVASGGAGLVAAHYCASGSNAGNITTILALVTGVPVSVS